MSRKKSQSRKHTTRRLFDIESKDRLTSDSIGALSDKPELLKEYLESSISNTFSELMFRLTHEVYAEEKATALWRKIVEHRENLRKILNRDLGMLVAALDYLTNVSGDMTSPKIIEDLRLEEAADMATRDTLTGLYLRSVFDFSLKRMVREHTRYERPLSLLMMDVDNFKKVNDEHGHQAGDKALRRIGKMILNGVRSADFPARYGGEEIAIIFPETAIDQAALMADRLRGDLRRYFEASPPAITVSIGVSTLRKPDVETELQLIWQADKAMYEAKRAGRDRVVCSA
jgi:diguanylate cyclase (GGDEF)-like protein